MVEVNRVPEENYQQTLSEFTSPWARFEITHLVVIGTDCIGSRKSNYHVITTTTVPILCHFTKNDSNENTFIENTQILVTDYLMYRKMNNDCLM